MKPSKMCSLTEKQIKYFWDRVDIRSPQECWNWKKSTQGSGHCYYGICQFNWCRTTTNRWAYAVTNGAIPQGLSVLHKCDNGLCCNPAHLFLGTYTDNVRDCITKGRRVVHCGENHPLATLTNAQVAQIKKEAIGRKRGWIAEKASSLGLSYDVIVDIVRGKSWKSVPSAK